MVGRHEVRSFILVLPAEGFGSLTAVAASTGTMAVAVGLASFPGQAGFSGQRGLLVTGIEMVPQ